MAKLEFKVSANRQPVDDLYESIDRLDKQAKGLGKTDFGLDNWTKQFEKFKRELRDKADEIEKTKAKIASFDNWNDKKGLDSLEKQLNRSEKEYDILMQTAVDAANKFQESFDKTSAALLESQKNVDAVTWRLIEQKEVVANLQSEIRRLNEAYRSADQSDKSGISTQISSKKQQLEDERVSLNGLRSEQERAKLTVKSFKDEMSNYQKSVSNTAAKQNEAEFSLKKMLATFGGAAAVKAFVSDMINVRGEFQKTQMAFETMLGSKEKADMLMSQMVQTAAKTPFDLQGVADGAKQLLTYGTEAKDVNETLIRLGNVASGLNIPLGDMVYLYGTTQTQGRLFTQDVRQFMGRGIPLVKELASMLGKTEEEINKMVTAGQIGFAEVEKVIKKMTDEGGQFYNLMEKQSQTLSGQISNLGDAWDQMLNSIGEDTQGVASTTIAMAAGVVENYERIGKVLVSLIGLYGIHKATVIAVSVATNGLTMAENLLYLKSEALLKINKLLNATMLSNPFVLVATVAAGLIATMWLLHDSTTASEKAQKQLNKEHEEASKRKQELASKTDGLISKINSETGSVYSQIKAYKELIKLYPELGNISFEEFKNLPQDQQKKMFSNINEKREVNDSQKAYEEDLKRIEYLKKAINVAATLPNSGTTLAKLNEQLDTANNLSKLHKDEIDKIKEAQWEANTPVEAKVKHYEDVKNSLVAERNEIETTLKKSEDVTSAWMGMPDIISSIKLDALNKQIEETTGKIDSLTGNGASGVKNKSYWEKKKQDAETARDALATSEKNSEDWNKYTLEIQKSQKEIDKYSDSSKEEDKALKAQQALSRSIFESEIKIQAGRTSIMEDGKNKRLALAKQEYDEAIRQINTNEKEQLSKPEATKEQKDEITNNASSLRLVEAQKLLKANTDIEKEYEKEYQERTKALTDVFLNEEQRKTNAIKDRYAKERTWADEQLATGGMTKEEHKSYTANVDQSEMKENYNSLLAGLNDYKQQEAELTATWKKRISEAEKTGDAELIERMKAGRDKALSTLNSQMLQESADWMRLFGNLDTLTVDELNNLIDSIQKQLDSGTLKLNPIDAKALMESLNEAKEKIAEKSPFQALSKSSGEMKTAMAELKKAEDNGLTGEALDVYKKNVKNAAENVKKSISAIGDAYGQVSDVMRSAADLISMVDEGVGETINNALSLGDAVMNVGQVVAQAVVSFAAGMSAMETASVILLVIKAVILAVMAALALFNGDKKHEKKIKELQDQVDTLERSYDKLGRAVEKVYSQDAADIIGEQNDNLEKQNELLRQQIAEEEAKKKTDKDKIKEWENAIEDNNQLIEENKEKAVDAIFGSDIKSAIDDLASAYADAWANGEDRAKAMKDVVKKMINGVIIEMLKSDLAPTVALLREKIQQAIADGVITDAEQAEIDALINSAVADADKKYAPLDKYLKGDLSESDLLGSSSDSLADSIIEGLKAGKSGIKEFSSSFEDMMRTAILNSLKTKYLEAPLKEFYKKFAEMSESGGQLTEAEIEELRDMYANIIDGAKVHFDSMKEISGLDFTGDSDNTLKGAYAKASQESIDLLAGQTGAQRIAIESIREHMQFIRDLQFQGWQDVKAIRDLSGKIADNTRQIEQNSRQLNDIAGKIEMNTNKTFNALDGTINVKVKM